MDAKLKPLMPEIKAEVNKVDDGKKKATGLFGGLFGGGGSGAAGGLGAGGGGLLATKAGMLALVIVGSSVAGGIGLAGYKMFGPGEADQAGGNLSLFAPKPQQAPEDGVAPVAADGSSQSLSLMAQSAAKDKAADASGEAAPADNTAGSGATAAVEAAQRASASAGAINSGGGAGATGTMGGSLTGVKKLGALSGASSSSGGGSVSSAAGASSRLGDNLANATRNGAASAFSKGGPGAKASGARGMAARGGRGARAQARAVMGDQARGRAGSSFAAGRTYDGSATNSGGAIGPDGSAISMGGAGDGGAAQPKALSANQRVTPQEQDVPPPGEGKAIVTEWEKNIKKMTMLAALAAVLFYLAGKIKAKTFGTYWTDIIVKAMGYAIVAIGVAIGVLAGMVMNGVNGEPGQKMQGGFGIVASLLAIGAGVYTIMNPPGEAEAKQKAAEAKALETKNAADAEAALRRTEDLKNVEKIREFDKAKNLGNETNLLA